jgi:hypothetical protein
LCFLIGAAYFVAGSYPESSEEDDLSISFKSSKNKPFTSASHLTTPFIGRDDV